MALHVTEKEECSYHDEHEVGKLAQSGVLPKGLDQRCDVLFGVRPRHGQDGRLARVAQEPEDLLLFAAHRKSGMQK